jgi:PAS domain S-box-containing protein
VADRDAAEIEFGVLMAMVDELHEPPPVVCLSTDDSGDAARSCLAQGAAAFLHKLRLDEIGELMRGLMESRGRPGAAPRGDGRLGARSLGENADDLIVEISSDGRLVYVSPSVEKALGFRAEELAGRRAFEFVHPDDLTVTLEFLQKAAETGAAARGLHRVRRRDGSWRWVESAANPYFTAAGERCLVSISRDVTERLRETSPSAPRETTAGSAVGSDPAVTLDGSAAFRVESDHETILLVEDQERLRSVIRGNLADEGYEVVEAADGDEALQRAAQHAGPIHVVLSEVELPGMGGRELAMRICAARPRTGVILLSDAPGEDSLPFSRGLRPARLLRKPFTLASLHAKLCEVLEEDAGRRESG